MKTLLVLMICWSVALGCPVYGQTGSSSAAPVQTAGAQPRPAARSEKNRPRAARDAASPGATVTPKSAHKNAQPRLQPALRPAISYSEAVKRHHRERHDRDWWKSHFTVIVFVTGCGYYYWDAGYWFPAFGYDPRYENYDNDGPIFTYGDLLPDQVIYNVQRALKEYGYDPGPLTGSLSTMTRRAIAAFQEDNGLDVTGAIDAPTVQALGLY
jgi:Putative peptidoglycan binding domain